MTLRVRGQTWQSIRQDYLQKVPEHANYFNVALDIDGSPNLADVARAAQDRVGVRIQLHELAQVDKIDSIGFHELMNIPLLKTAIRAWLMEILVSGFNFFVLMNLIYEPKWGALVAHQIGMSTRIVYIFVFAYFLLRFAKEYSTKDLVHVGILWLVLTLLFEWVGSFAIGRSVEEILVGWNIFAGYMWPYVLLTYLLSNLTVGIILHPGKKRAAHVRENTMSNSDMSGSIEISDHLGHSSQQHLAYLG